MVRQGHSTTSTRGIVLLALLTTACAGNSDTSVSSTAGVRFLFSGDKALATLEVVDGRAEIPASNAKQLDGWAFNRATKNLDEVAAVVVSIVDADDASIFEREPVTLNRFGDAYLSSPLALSAGNYALTEFMVVDHMDRVLYATPAVGSPLEHLVARPVPIPFEVHNDEVAELGPEVVAVTDRSPADFGYASFGVDIVDIIDFSVQTFMFDEIAQHLVLTTAEITVEDASEVLYAGELNASNNRIAVPDGRAHYEVVVTKPDFRPYIAVFTAEELKAHWPGGARGPLVVVLKPGINAPTIDIDFVPEINDGAVNRADGIAAGSSITFDLCGTASVAGAVVEVVIDGLPPQPARVTGTDWCLDDLTLAESAAKYDVKVTAELGDEFGLTRLLLAVDASPPGAVGVLAASQRDRRSAVLSWTAPDDRGQPADRYIVKLASELLTDSNFDTTGTEFASLAPSAPGTGETLVIDARPGTEYYAGVAAVDAAGNRTVAEIAGPFSVDFDHSGAVSSVRPEDDENGLGFQMAGGDYNNDGFSDVAVAAPFKSVGGDFGVGSVYVYYGGENGLADPVGSTVLGDPIEPDVTIEGTELGAQFGNGVTAIDWNRDGIDDLAIGAPFGDNFNGGVQIFFGGDAFDENPEVSIGVNDSDPANWFLGGLLGWSLAAADFDGDQNDDLVMSAVFGGQGNGGVAVLYGGTDERDIRLASNDASASGDARVVLVEDPELATNDLFGSWVYNLGHLDPAAGAMEDIGVAHFDGSTAFVIRGRRQPNSAGVTSSGIDATRDLEIRHPTAGNEKVYFGSAMGSLADINDDGARDIVIGAWGEDVFADLDGRLYIIAGNAIGTLNVANAITTISPEPGLRKFATAIANNALAKDPDVDGDGREDLLVVGGADGGGGVQMFIWYGGAIPIGAVTTSSAAHSVAGPADFRAPIPPSTGTPMAATWVGDTNRDGLEDVCWADTITLNRDGAFELLWDDKGR
ncbi:MAG: FG-GAP-like repeat-containing protein [Proteobacteria bacterium]|nr:FG-GAP-like repeat-containing protein [Pseudomonadota bacterium]